MYLLEAKSEYVFSGQTEWVMAEMLYFCHYHSNYPDMKITISYQEQTLLP